MRLTPYTGLILGVLTTSSTAYPNPNDLGDSIKDVVSGVVDKTLDLAAEITKCVTSGRKWDAGNKKCGDYACSDWQKWDGKNCVDRCDYWHKWDGKYCVDRCDDYHKWDGKNCVDKCDWYQKWDGKNCVDRCDQWHKWDGKNCVDKCDSWQKWDGKHCVDKCGWGQKWDDHYNKCYDRCDNYHKWDGKNCVDKCDNYHKWDGKNCVDKCDHGWKWDDKYNKCYKEEENKCDNGWKWDDKVKKCIGGWPQDKGECKCDDSWKGGKKCENYFTSTYYVKAVPEEVVDASNKPTGGLKGASSEFYLGVNSKTNTICYTIKLWGFQGDYDSPALTATHLHQGDKGKSGPPRVVFPDPVATGKGDERISVGCLTVPIKTGVKVDDKDAGENFYVKQIEENPKNFYTDIHSSKAKPGAVRGQLKY